MVGCRGNLSISGLINCAWGWFKHAPTELVFSRMFGAFPVAMLPSLTKNLFLARLGFSFLFLSLMLTMLKIAFYDIDMFDKPKHGPLLFRASAKAFFLLVLTGMLFLVGMTLMWFWEASEIV